MGIRQNRKHAVILNGILSGEKLQQQLHHTHGEMVRELTHARYYSSDALWYSMQPLKNKLSNTFAQEEQLMTQHIYPRQTGHRNEHELFLFHFNIFFDLCRSKSHLPLQESSYQHWRHLYWLCEWLKNHIQWSDHFFYHYLQHKIDSRFCTRISSAVLSAAKPQEVIGISAEKNYSAEHVILKTKIL